MATGLKSRVIFKEHGASNTWEGTYKLLMRAKSIPSPVGERSMVDVSTLEDDMEVQEPGIRAAASLKLQGAMEKNYLDSLDALTSDIDVMILYGTDGIGSIAKYAFTSKGGIDITPDEASSDHLTMSVNIPVSTTPVLVTDNYDVAVVYEEDGETVKEFTVTKKS